MGHQRHPAVAGDHQAQSDQSQIGAFLLGLAPLRDGRLGVGGVDVGSEVGHVQGQRGQVQAEGLDHAQRQPVLDGSELPRGDGVHRLPELAVIQHRGPDPGEPVGGGGLPPRLEPQLRTRRHHPVARGQRQVGAHARAGV